MPNVITYDDTLGRVRISATGLGLSDYATVEQSTDQIRWTTVRGGGAVPVTAGAFATTFVDSYEFAPDVPNFYRVRGIQTSPGPITYRNGGLLSTNNNGPVFGFLPSGIVAGDLLILIASIRNSAGTPNTPAGWTIIHRLANLALFGRRYVAGDTTPTVTFSGGVTNADCIARVIAFQGADLTARDVADLTNTAAQNIAAPALVVAVPNRLLVDVVWKQDDAPAGITARDVGWAPAGALSNSTVGDDATHEAWYQVQTAATNVPAGNHVVSGGTAAISLATTISLGHAAYLYEQITPITPVVGGVWLKSIARPHLDLKVQPRFKTGTPITQPAHGAVFEIIGRSYPIAVTDVRGSRRWTLYLHTDTQADAQALGYLLASGDVLLLQPPAAVVMPGGYVFVGDVSQVNHPLRPWSIDWTLPLTEVAPPGPDVVGVTVTWQTVLDAYGSWGDLVEGQASWLDVLSLVAAGSEVIVP